MNNENRIATGASFPVVPILTITFVVLKLTNVIDWSWGWVLSPLWLSAAFVAVMVLFALIIAFIVALCKE